MRISFGFLPLAVLGIGMAVLAGCGPTTIVDQKAGAGLRIGSLSFSPDEKQLAYATADWTKKKSEEDEGADSDETTKTGRFQVATIAGSTKPASIDVEACAAGNAYRMRWAHSEKKMAVAARDALLVLEPKKGKKPRFDRTQLVASTKDCADKNPARDILSLVWSPDDSTIAYSDGATLHTISVEGGQPTKVEFAAPLPGAETDRLTLLEWTSSGWIVKRGPMILSIDPETRTGTVRHALGPKDDWVTTSEKGAIYVVTSDGKVQEVRASGPKTVLTLKATLAPKTKAKSKARHQYVIELSPSGKYLAVAESLVEKGRSGSVLALMNMPGAKGKDAAKKAKAKAKKAPVEEEAVVEEGAGETKPEGKTETKKSKAAAKDEAAAEEPSSATDEDAPKGKDKE